MPKLQFSKGRWSLTIPYEAVAAKHWQKSQPLLIIFNERGNLEIKELAPEKNSPFKMESKTA